MNTARPVPARRAAAVRRARLSGADGRGPAICGDGIAASAAANPVARRWSAAALALMLLGACAGERADEGFEIDFTEAESRIDYAVAQEGAPTEEIAGLIEASLGLYRRQGEGAQSVAFLRKRARDDVATVERILRSRGYYEGTADIAVTAPESGGPAEVRLTVAPGPAYTLASHGFDLVETGGTPPDLPEARALGAPVGRRAKAGDILAAEQAAVRHLRETGRPYAEFLRRDAVADPEADTLEVTSTIATGPAYVFGAVEFAGNPDVDADYLATYVPWMAGDMFDTRQIAEFQRRLVATDLFRSVTVTPPDSPPEGAFAPVAVEMEQREFRTISAGLRVNTDTGPGIRLGFEHRNLFGANERLTLSLEGELDEQEFSARFSKPQFLRPGQFLEAEVKTFVLDDSPFDAAGLTGTAGLRRQITPALSVGAGGLFEIATIDEPETDGASALIGVPAFVAWDTSDDLLNATRGQRARLTVTPFSGTFNEEATAFLSVEAQGATYHDLTGDGGHVLAGRARLGTTIADSVGDVPQTRRFYAGGGGSVRGFDRYDVGPLDERNDPVGGLSVAEIGAEYRGRIWGDLGGVVFTDAGTVSTESGFAFDDDFLVAAGAGLRYYSPVGPIRLDVAFPLNGRDVDDTFEVYFSVGQAF